MKPAWYLHGEYSTHIYTRESVKIIKNYNSTKPLFLYVAHAAVHSGNKYNPLPAPDKTVDKLDHIQNYNRRRYAGKENLLSGIPASPPLLPPSFIVNRIVYNPPAMVSELDTSVGNIISALKDANMLSNSIVIFSTDNGGPANGLNYNYASNWPMRGVKNTLWEGGVRGVGVVWSSKFKPNSGGRVSNRMMHICDWLPTLYAAAGGDVRDLGENLDGYNMWNSLLDDLPSPRNEILHNIDDIFGNSALTMSQWKLVKGEIV